MGGLGRPFLFLRYSSPTKKQDKIPPNKVIRDKAPKLASLSALRVFFPINVRKKSKLYLKKK